MCEKFSLKWNDYLDNVSKKFSSLRYEDEFSDVSLVSSDKRQVSAHRVVLSSSSDYFKTILKSNNKSKDIILCLENINQEELNNMLDYVYNGEVNIEQDQLDRFLAIAQRFQLEGLISDKRGELEAEDTHSSVVKYSDTIYPKHENGDQKKKITQNGLKEHIIISSDEFQSVEELDEKLKENLSRIEGGMWQCKICNKMSKKLHNAKEHAEIHIEGLSHPCQSCNSTFRSRNIRRTHQTRVCNGKLFSGPGTH